MAQKLSKKSGHNKKLKENKMDYVKFKKISMKDNTEFNEKWVQEIVTVHGQ